MRLLLFLLLVGINAFAVHAQIDCSSTAIGTSYTASTPGLPISGLVSASNSHIALWNPSGTRICIDAGQQNNTAPASGGSSEHCIPATSFFAWDFVPVGASIFIRADGATCTSTTIDIDVW